MIVRTGVFLFLFICAAVFFAPVQAFANSKYASIVVDAETGKVLRARNANKQLYPASLTKMMTLYMAFDALSRGQISLKDRIRISRRAAGMVPSKLNLPVGSSIKVEDAILALVTKSANDVAVAIGEHLAGSEWAFASKMTAKAHALGMNNTVFKNASGLPDTKQKTTARDMAILARALIYNHPQYYHYFSTKNFNYRGANYGNHNKLLKTYKGMDGIKTGYIAASGFNLVASAVQDNRRLVAVVFGGQSSKSRNAHMVELLDEGFRMAKKLPRVQIAAARVPTPDKKPDITQVVLASLKSNSTENKTPPATIVARNEVTQGENKIDEILGQGDVDPNTANRLETGLMAIAAHTGHIVAMDGVGQYGKEEKLESNNIGSAEKWAVQIGAYSSEKISQQAIRVASNALPPEMRGMVNPKTLPLTTGSRTIYRARMEGFNEHTAQKACAYLRNCMVIAP